MQLSCGRGCVSRAAQPRRWECPAGQDCTMERLSGIMHWKTQQKMSATLSLRPAHHLYTRLMQDCLLRSRPSETIQVGSKAAIISQRLPLRKVIALGILELFDAAGQSFHNFRDVVTHQTS